MYEDQKATPVIGKEKEKKKFWGMDMGWAAGKKEKDKDKDKDKDKGRDKDHLGVKEESGGGRRSFDWSRAQDHTVNQTGYSVTAPPGVQGPNGVMPNMGSAMVMEDEQRGRMAGRMFFRDHESKDPTAAKDVSAAIREFLFTPREQS
jgi:hypothetical protein